MELKAKRSSFGIYGNVRRGGIIEVEDKKKAEALIATGLYTEYDEKAERQAKEEREAKALAEAEAAKTAEAVDEEASRAIAVQLDVLKAGNATLVLTVAERDAEITGLKSTVAERDAEIVGLRKQLEERAVELEKIPLLESAISRKDAALADFEKQLSAFKGQDGVPPADDGSSNETGKKSAGKKEGK